MNKKRADRNEEWQKETTRLAPKKETVTEGRKNCPWTCIGDKRVQQTDVPFRPQANFVLV